MDHPVVLIPPALLFVSQTMKHRQEVGLLGGRENLWNLCEGLSAKRWTRAEEQKGRS
jgi:hypothetical protein